MIKKFLCISFMLVIFSIWAFDDLTSKGVSSPYNKAFTGENYQTNYKVTSSLTTYDFPLHKPLLSNLGRTLTNYFIAKDKKQSLLLYQENGRQIEGHVFGGLEYYQNNDSDYYILPYYGFEVKAKYKSLSMAGKWWKGHTNKNNDYANSNYLINSWVQRDDNMIYIDKIQGEIKYDIADFGYIALKRGKLDIASNIGGSIILNDEKTNDYTYLNYHYKFGDFSLDFAHASLIADSINTSGPGSISKLDAPDKYLALHRFGWRPSNNLFMFVGEEIFYGNRAMDLNYFLPVGFWRITEHNQADRDNILIFAGIEYSPLQNLSLYTNVIFDELSKSKIFTSWWGNKYALQTGLMQKNIYTSSFLAWKSAGLEFTAIRPWIYTHKYLYTKASNDDHPLGFADGANLLKYTFDTSLAFLNNKITWNINASYMRQGNEGNNFSSNYEYEIEDTENHKASWLEGNITDTYKLKQELDFSLLYSHRLKVSYELLKTRKSSSESEIVISYQTRF